MAFVESRPQRSAVDDAPTGVDRDTVLLSAHGIQHGSACGVERIECPLHGAPYGPHYLPAERQKRRGGTFVFAHDCGGAWREISA